MRELQRRVRTALSEARILALSSQMLLGTQLTATFHDRFTEISAGLRTTILVAIFVSLLAFIVLLIPTAFHQLVLRGGDTKQFLALTSNVTAAALVPILIGTTLVMFAAARLVIGTGSASVIAAITAAVCFVLWYRPDWFERLLDAVRRSIRVHEENTTMDSRQPKSDIKARIDHVLTEARVVLPGVQAFVGFQFAAMLSRVFEDLPNSSKIVHLSSLGLVTLSGILLITPAAFHRIVERGELTERFHRVASTLMLLALVPLALGFALDLYVVAREAIDSVPIALFLSAATAVLTYSLWFGFSYYWRRRRAVSV
jgi:hypothetical protein